MLAGESTMTSRQVVETWIARFNAADADGLAALYHEDAINHQVATDPVVGRAAILERFKQEFANAEMVCIARLHPFHRAQARPKKGTSLLWRNRRHFYSGLQVGQTELVVKVLNCRPTTKASPASIPGKTGHLCAVLAAALTPD